MTTPILTKDMLLSMGPEYGLCASTPSGDIFHVYTSSKGWAFMIVRGNSITGCGSMDKKFKFTLSGLTPVSEESVAFLNNIVNDKRTFKRGMPKRVSSYWLSRQFTKMLSDVDFHSVNYHVEDVDGIPTIKGKVIIWDDFCEQTGYIRTWLEGMYKKYEIGYHIKFK